MGKDPWLIWFFIVLLFFVIWITSCSSITTKTPNFDKGASKSTYGYSGN